MWIAMVLTMFWLALSALSSFYSCTFLNSSRTIRTINRNLGNQVRVADPTFLGYFIDKGAASAAKVVRKVYSNSFLIGSTS